MIRKKREATPMVYDPQPVDLVATADIKSDMQH